MCKYQRFGQCGAERMCPRGVEEVHGMSARIGYMRLVLRVLCMYVLDTEKCHPRYATEASRRTTEGLQQCPRNATLIRSTSNRHKSQHNTDETERNIDTFPETNSNLAYM